MPSLYTPQSQAGVTSFYDAPTNGPKFHPKLIMAIAIAFTLIVLIADHFVYAA